MIKTPSLRSWLVTACALAAAALPGSAAAVSLNVLFGGADLIVGDKIFHDWEDFGGTGIDPGLVEVTGRDDDPLKPGLRYTSDTEFLVEDGATAEFSFQFTVSTLSAEPLIIGNELQFGNTSLVRVGGQNDASYAQIRIDESLDFLPVVDAKHICRDIGGLGGAPNPCGLIFAFDSKAFSPRASIDIVTFVRFETGVIGDMAQMFWFDQRFAQVPEPPAAFLLGAPLMLLCAAARRPGRSNSPI